MKRYLITFLLLFFVMSVGFSEANLFSLIDLNDFINIEKLESFSDSYFFQDFEKSSKKSICKVCVKIKRPDKKETHICYYNSKGLLEKEESRSVSTVFAGKGAERARLEIGIFAGVGRRSAST